MKVSQEEIDAAQKAFYASRGFSNEWIPAVLQAAYTVRRARKQAKRERQRKEKDKQVVESIQWSAEELDRMKATTEDGRPTINKLPPLVESVKPAYPNVAQLSNNMIAGQFTPSKAPEWDGTFNIGDWEALNGQKVHIIGAYLNMPDCLFPLWSDEGRFYNLAGQQQNHETADFDLIRPWPKGKQ